MHTYIIFIIILFIVVSTERPQVSYTETCGGANISLFCSDEGRRTQNIWFQSGFLRRMSKSENLRRYANTPGHAYYRIKQWPKWLMQCVRHTIQFSLICFFLKTF